MPSLRDIRRRIRSISSTAQITRAMQMVASSKMRKAQQSTLTMRPFAQLMYRMQRRAAMKAADFVHPLMQAREVRKRAVIVVGTDKGLCGGLNTNLFRAVTQFDLETTVFIAAGKRVAQFLAQTQRKMAAEFTFSDTPRYAEARAIAAFARDMFLNREVDEVRVVATRFINTLNQQAGAVEYLPVGEITAFKIGAGTEEELAAQDVEYAFEPNAEAFLGYLLSIYINVFMFRVLQEAKASEQSARMVAMKNATDNATTLIEDLTLEYNKLRQGMITTELLDISGGQLGSE